MGAVRDGTIEVHEVLVQQLFPVALDSVAQWPNDRIVDLIVIRRRREAMRLSSRAVHPSGATRRAQ